MDWNTFLTEFRGSIVGLWWLFVWTMAFEAVYVFIINIRNGAIPSKHTLLLSSFFWTVIVIYWFN